MSASTVDRENDFYFRTHRFANWIIRFYRSLSGGDLKYTVGKQLLRSGTAVGAILREARRARSTAEFRSKMTEALQEAEESLYWISLLPTAELGSSKAHDVLSDEIDEIVAMLVSGLKNDSGT